jgi:3-phytase
LLVSQSASATTLEYVGVQTIPTGTVVGGTEIGGLSGLSYNPYTDRFLAVTDDSRSDGASRIWSLDLVYDGATFSSATAQSFVALKKPDGSTLPLADTEGIAGNLDGSFYVSHEGLAAGSDAASSIPPWIFRFHGATGNREAEVALPAKFLPRDSSGNPVAPSAANQASGVVSNLSLECLGITPAKKLLFAANEAALKQDYNGTYNNDTNQAQSSLTRIVRFSGVPGNPMAAQEKVYQADQGTLFFLVRRFNTVPEILPIDDSGRMLVMERGLTQNNTNLGSYRIRIYEVDFNQPGATDVSGIASLVGASYTRLSKTLIWESSANMDNVEAMCFGRDVNGFRTLVLASDNNFNGSQTTQFHVLRTNIPAVTRRALGTTVLGNGSVTAAPSVAWYPDGSEVTVSAAPSAGFLFSNWSGSLSGSNNPASLTMDADRSVAARFVSTYQSWKTGYFTPEEISGTQLSDPTSDPEGDGLQNLLEYALNLHPREASRVGLPEVGQGGGNLTLTYQKDTTKTDISYQVEVSDSLSGWGPWSDELVSLSGTVETRRAAVPILGTSRYLRLKITTLF